MTMSRNPIQKAFGSPEVKRHQVHQDKRRDRRVKHRERIFLRDEY
jgi:hypothetical protein